MNRLIKISLKTGLVTAGAILLYEAIDQLYLYYYLRYEYYITGIAITGLLTGIILTWKYFTHHTQPADDPLATLTPKELAILELIYEGKSNKEIAAQNFTELSTVKTHINNIYTKLCVKNRKEAAAAWQKSLSQAKSTLSPP